MKRLLISFSEPSFFGRVVSSISTSVSKPVPNFSETITCVPGTFWVVFFYFLYKDCLFLCSLSSLNIFTFYSISILKIVWYRTWFPEPVKYSTSLSWNSLHASISWKLMWIYSHISLTLSLSEWNRDHSFKIKQRFLQSFKTNTAVSLHLYFVNFACSVTGSGKSRCTHLNFGKHSVSFISQEPISERIEPTPSFGGAPGN